VIGPGCNMPVLDSQRRAKLCGARATTTRKLDGIDFSACADCAAAVDASAAKGEAYTGRSLAPDDLDAKLKAKWDAEQAKLPPHKRRTWEQALDDDERRHGRALRRARKRGDL
jgi:hypothetical protein